MEQTVDEQKKKKEKVSISAETFDVELSVSMPIVKMRF